MKPIRLIVKFINNFFPMMIMLLFVLLVNPQTLFAAPDPSTMMNELGEGGRIRNELTLEQVQNGYFSDYPKTDGYPNIKTAFENVFSQPYKWGKGDGLTSNYSFEGIANFSDGSRAKVIVHFYGSDPNSIFMSLIGFNNRAIYNILDPKNGIFGPLVNKNYHDFLASIYLNPANTPKQNSNSNSQHHYDDYDETEVQKIKKSIIPLDGIKELRMTKNELDQLNVFINSFINTPYSDIADVKEMRDEDLIEFALWENMSNHYEERITRDSEGQYIDSRYVTETIKKFFGKNFNNHKDAGFTKYNSQTKEYTLPPFICDGLFGDAKITHVYTHSGKILILGYTYLIEENETDDYWGYFHAYLKPIKYAGKGSWNLLSISPTAIEGLPLPEKDWR